ncbi:MAG: insulinase family protein [Pirellulales bacterium]|nr:insulinase family protein [Pirellulales bacterium]
MEFKRAQLDNGLEVIAECNPNAYTSAVGFFVQTGARDESDQVAGVSHFLEHMVFKGSERRTPDDVNRQFDELGASYNAFTSEESTVYYASFLPEYLERVVDIWSDILRPALRDADFDTEKQVIIEEIRMYEDQPPFGADEKCKAAFFGEHPLGRSVLGTIDSIGQLHADQMREYFRCRYSPRNIVLVAAGRIEFDRLVDLAARHCGHWLAAPAPREVVRAKPLVGFHAICKASATQQYVLQLSDAPAATDADRFAAKLLATVLGDDSGSRMYWELVDPGRADQASLGHYEYEGSGAFMTYLSCEPDLIADNLQRVLDLFREAESDGITAAELDQAKNKINARVVLASERPRGRLFNLGSNWTHRREYRRVQDDLAAVDAVTLDDLRAVLAKYPLSRNTTVTIGPLTTVAAPR